MSRPIERDVYDQRRHERRFVVSGASQHSMVWDCVPCWQLRALQGEEASMRVLGLAGLVIALAILGYLIVGYLGEAGKARDALQAVPGSQVGQPVDLGKRGLEQRLSPILDQERKRVEETTKAAGQ